MNFYGITLSETDLWLLGVVSICFAWLIPHWLSVSREKHFEYRTASTKFRSAVIAELGNIYPIVIKWPENEEAFFKSIFLNLQVAVTEFRHFIPWYKRRAFDNAWLRYYCAYPKQTKEQIYHHYVASFDPSIDTKENAIKRRNKTFYENVSKILYFACNK